MRLFMAALVITAEPWERGLLASCGGQTSLSAVSPVVGHRLQPPGLRQLWAQLSWGAGDLPGPGTNPVSPASAGGVLPTEPPAKPSPELLWLLSLKAKQREK